MSDIIIIIDKKPFLPDTLEMVISHYFPDKFTIIAFSDTTSAFNVIEELSIKKETISLIISDSEMPYVKGYDFLNLINTLSPNSIKVLATAYIKFSIYQDLLSKSIVDFILEKPFNTNSLINIVKFSIIQQNLINEKHKNLETIHLLKNSISILRNKFQLRGQNFITINDYLNAFYFRLDLKNSLLKIYTNSTDIFGYEVSALNDFDSFLSLIAPYDQKRFIESVRKIKVNIASKEQLYMQIIDKNHKPFQVRALLLRENNYDLIGTETIVGFIQNMNVEDKEYN